MAMVNKTGTKGANPHFVAKSSPGVSVSPGKGGVNIGTPTHCVAKRAASNVKSY